MTIKNIELEQKIGGNNTTICTKCFHSKVCKGIENQPCFECNQFFDLEKYTTNLFNEIIKTRKDK